MEEKRYKIQYRDQSELGLYLTEEKYAALATAICDGKPAIILDEIGVLRLEEVRTVIYVPDLPPNESYNPELSKEEEEYIAYLKLADELLKENEIDSDGDDTLGGIPV